MGLDVYHIQLTSQPVNKDDYLEIEEWDLCCNVPIENYSKFIKQIDTFDYKKSIGVVKNDELFENLKSKGFLNDSEYMKIFIGDLSENMIKNINSYITNAHLDGLEILELGCEHEGLKFHSISFGEPIKIEGIYYVGEIGYQRKGMNSQFYDIFNSYTFWGKKEDFELAYTFVEDDWYLADKNVKELTDNRDTFKANFIDKFEFGKSLLWV